MIVYLNNMGSDLELFIRRNFNGFSYDGGYYNRDLDSVFLRKEAIDTDQLYLHYTRYRINAFNIVVSEDRYVKFFDFEYGANDFIKSIVCDRLVPNLDNDYNIQDLINICINAGVIPKNTKVDGAYLHSLCGTNACNIGLALYCEDRDFIL